MTLKVNEATFSDMVQIERLYKKLYTGDEKQNFFASKLNPDSFKSGQIILVTKDKRKIVGYCWLVWYKHINEKGIGYLEELYVDVNMRNRGIGKELINAALSKLKDLEIKNIYCAVGKHMRDSQEFYKHIGFEKSTEIWFEKKYNCSSKEQNNKILQ